jgi:hypothetical protein
MIRVPFVWNSLWLTSVKFVKSLVATFSMSHASVSTTCVCEERA